MQDEEAVGKEDEDVNPNTVVKSLASKEGQQHVQEAAAEALAGTPFAACICTYQGVQC